MNFRLKSQRHASGCFYFTSAIYEVRIILFLCMCIPTTMNEAQKKTKRSLIRNTYIPLFNIFSILFTSHSTQQLMYSRVRTHTDKKSVLFFSLEN